MPSLFPPCSRSRWRLAVGLAAIAAMAACDGTGDSSTETRDDVVAGGSKAAGGAAGSGGSRTTGGGFGMGGDAAGGVPARGGASLTGGAGGGEAATGGATGGDERKGTNERGGSAGRTTGDSTAGSGGTERTGGAGASGGRPLGGAGGAGWAPQSDAGPAVGGTASTGGTTGTGGTLSPDASTDGRSPEGASGSCYQEGLAAISQELLSADITMLASPDFEGRMTGTAGERKAIDYIVGQLKAAGLEGVAGNHEQPFTAKGMTSANTVAVVVGSDADLKDEVIVLGAHHDHMGKTTRSYYPGADDNASGTAAVMALGRAFAKCEGQLKRTLLFMTFGGEEEGILGSLYYTKNPLFPIAKTMYMVNFDMIGYVAKNKLEVSWGSTLARDVLTTACRSLGFCMLIRSDMVNEIGTDSDSFAAARVPYTGFFSGFHDCYHKTCDTADKLDMKGVTDTTKLSFELVHLLATTDQSLAKPASRTAGMTIDRAKQPFLDHGVAPIDDPK